MREGHGHRKRPFNCTFLLFHPPALSPPSPATNLGVCGTHLHALFALPPPLIYSICLRHFVCSSLPVFLFVYDFLIFSGFSSWFGCFCLFFLTCSATCDLCEISARSESAAATSASWSLSEAGLLKQCLVQRYRAETADRMGPTGRSN